MQAAQQEGVRVQDPGIGSWLSRDREDRPGSSAIRGPRASAGLQRSRAVQPAVRAKAMSQWALPGQAGWGRAWCCQATCPGASASPSARWDWLAQAWRPGGQSSGSPCGPPAVTGEGPGRDHSRGAVCWGSAREPVIPTRSLGEEPKGGAWKAGSGHWARPGALESLGADAARAWLQTPPGPPSSPTAQVELTALGERTSPLCSSHSTGNALFR